MIYNNLLSYIGCNRIGAFNSANTTSIEDRPTQSASTTGVQEENKTNAQDKAEQTQSKIDTSNGEKGSENVQMSSTNVAESEVTNAASSNEQDLYARYRSFWSVQNYLSDPLMVSQRLMKTTRDVSSTHSLLFLLLDLQNCEEWLYNRQPMERNRQETIGFQEGGREEAE